MFFHTCSTSQRRWWWRRPSAQMRELNGVHSTVVRTSVYDWRTFPGLKIDALYKSTLPLPLPLPSINVKMDYKSEGEYDLRWWHHLVGHFRSAELRSWWITYRSSQPQIQPTSTRRRYILMASEGIALLAFRMNNWCRWVRSRYLGPWLQKMASVRRNSVPG